MRILLTNDDGVYAPGLAALYAAMNGDHEITVIAPETEQSAVGHAITLADPIRVRELGKRTGFTGFAVSGTPADCVKLAIHELMDHPPELVISGINLGANLGINVLYSGTVSAATEAAFHEIPSMAISLDTHTNPDFSEAGRVAARIAPRLFDLGMPPWVCLNVNVPNLPADKIKGFRWTRQSQARLMERFIRRADPRGHVYYWQAGETMGREEDLDNDYPALAAGYITLTPILHDLTHHDEFRRLKANDLEL